MILLELINSYIEEVLNLPNNKKYVIKSIFKNMPRVSPINRKGTLFITFSKIICVIYLIYKFYDFFDGWIFENDKKNCDFQISANKKDKIND
jgi:hypothetical protein